jgi:hypothetical protein
MAGGPLIHADNTAGEGEEVQAASAQRSSLRHPDAMLAADRLLLRSQIKQKATELREKELNLFTSNFSAVATQAALLAGFSMAFLEMSVHLHGVHYNPFAKALLHLFATICICSNIFVVSIITFVSVWGSGKALRGRDGSMGKVIEGMNQERWLIFLTFGVGLISLLGAVACSTWLLMQWEVAGLATALLIFTCYALLSSGVRIFRSKRLQPPAAAYNGRPR